MGNPRSANGHRRRELRRRILATEDTCGICGQPVDVTLPAGLPASPEVDEIIPVSKGGDPLSRNNTRLAHRLCNQRRGNGTREQTPAPPPAQPATSRDWTGAPPPPPAPQAPP